MAICPGCGAPMHLQDGSDKLVCDYCKQVFTPEEDEEGVRNLGEASALDCPVCAVRLVHASMAHHRIFYCAQCHGTLIGMEEFVALLADLRDGSHGNRTVPRVPAAEELQRHILCPQCHRQMDTHFYAGPGNVIIDDCSPCGLDWLDAGELRRMARAPDHTYTPQSRSITDYAY